MIKYLEAESGELIHSHGKLSELQALRMPSPHAFIKFSAL